MHKTRDNQLEREYNQFVSLMVEKGFTREQIRKATEQLYNKMKQRANKENKQHSYS